VKFLNDASFGADSTPILINGGTSVGTGNTGFAGLIYGEAIAGRLTRPLQFNGGMATILQSKGCCWRVLSLDPAGWKCAGFQQPTNFWSSIGRTPTRGQPS
jgi:hypothetical protein